MPPILVFRPLGLEHHPESGVLIAEGASVPYVSRCLGHSSPAVTLAIYAHEFARAEHADRTRIRMEESFGGLLP
jgi:integrase